MNNRLLYLDSLRGFAILLVVVGHLIQFNYNDGLLNPVFNIIYSFHMPLFFFLSGCSRNVYENTKGIGVTSIRYLGKEIWSKFTSLIIPSVAWTFLVPLFFQNEIDFHFDAVSGYWFLNILFAINVLWGVISFFYNRLKAKWFVIASVILGILLCFILDVYRIPLTYFCAFALGYFWQHYSLSEKAPAFVVFTLCIIFLLFVGRYQYGDSLAGNPSRVWLLLPLSCIASIVLHWMFHKNSFNHKFLVELGQYSLGIYLCHYLFVRLSFVRYIQNDFSNIQQFFLLLLIAIFISYICVFIQKFIKQINWLGGFLYGNWKFLNQIKR